MSNPATPPRTSNEEALEILTGLKALEENFEDFVFVALRNKTEKEIQTDKELGRWKEEDGDQDLFYFVHSRGLVNGLAILNGAQDRILAQLRANGQMAVLVDGRWQQKRVADMMVDAPPPADA